MKRLVVLSMVLLLSVQQGNAQILCYSTNDCGGDADSSSVEDCCLNTLDGLTYAVRAGETCTRCFVYGWVREDDDGNTLPQGTITVDEGSTVNLTIGYQKGRDFAPRPRNFQITASGSAGSSDYQLVSSATQQLRVPPITITVQLLNDGEAGEMEETLTLTLTETNDPDVQNEILLETVDIRIRDINIQTGFADSNIILDEGEEAEISLTTLGMPRGDITLTVGVELDTAEDGDYTFISQQFEITPVNPEPSITFRADEDSIALEGIERLFLTLSGSDVVSITNGRLEVNITDTDVVRFSFAERDTAGRENVGVLNVPISRGNIETEQTITLVVTPVEYSLVNGTGIMLPPGDEYDPQNPNIATAGVDFNDSVLLVAVPPGDEDFDVQVQIFDDLIHENSRELFVLLLGLPDESPAGAEVNPQANTTQLIIRDNEAQVLDFEQKNYTLAETDSNVVYDLTITKRNQAEVTYSISIQEEAGGTADAGDFFLPTDVFLFRPEDDSITVPITIIGDDRVEVTENFFIDMEQASSVIFIPAERSYEIFIQDDDGDYILEFEADTYTVNEGMNVSVCFNVENPPPPKAGFEFQFIVTIMSSDGSAQAGADYVAISATFQGNTLERQCVTVETLQDLIVEDNETLIISASVDENLPVSFSDTAEVTIIDNEVVELGFSEASYEVLEGESVEVCLSLALDGSEAELEKAIVVSVESSDGTARSGDDYTAISEQFTFGPGAISSPMCVEAVMVDAAKDNIYELSENLTLTITTTDQSVGLSQNIAAVTIRDNTTVVVRFTETLVSVTEGESADVCAALDSEFSISDGPAASIELTPGFAMGTGITADEVTVCVDPGCDSTLVFNTTQREVCLSAQVEDDNTVESAESFSISLSTTQPRVNIANMVTFEVIDNDVEVGLSSIGYTTSEAAGSVEICAGVTSGNLSGRDLTVTVTTADGSATGTSDGSAIGIDAHDFVGGSYDIVFSGGSTLECTNIDIITDAVIEDAEDFSVALSIAAGGESFATVSDDQATVVIARDPLRIGFESEIYTTSEESGSVEVCAVVDGTLGRDATASIAVVGGTAEEGTDYAAFDGSLSFSSGDARACITITILSSPLVESQETIELQLTSSESDAVISPDSATVFIASDGAITVGFSSPAYTYTEGDTGYVLVQKSDAIVSEITFRVFGDGLVDETGTFQPGTASPNVINITFPTSDDEVALEDPELFTVRLEITPPNPLVELGISETVVTVLDDDVVTLGFREEDSTLNEDSGMFLVCVVKDRDTARDISFTVSDTGITASEPEDYMFNQTSPITFPAGDGEVCLSGTIINDDEYLEGTESFELSLNVITSSVIVDPATHTVSIVDDDLSPEITLSGPDVIDEGGGDATYCVSISVGIATPVTVDIAVEATGFAVAGEDYDASGVMSPFTLDPNTAMSCFSIGIIDDDIALEVLDGISVTISNPQPSSVSIINSQVMTAITDNDEVTVGFGSPSATTSEGVGDFMMCVVKDKVTAFDIDLMVTDLPDTATEPSDYIYNQSAYLQLSTTDTRTCFSISIVDDEVYLEGTESFALNISRARVVISNTGRVQPDILSPAMTTIFIEDNDLNPEIAFTAGPRAYPEDQDAMLCIGKVSQTIAVDITLDVTVTPGTAVAGDDYTATTNPPSPLTFAASEDSICFTISLIDDSLALEGDETFSVTLSNPVPSSVNITVSTAEITIVDNDVVTVGFGSPSATVSEGAGSFMMCVEKDGDTAVAVPFSVTDIPKTANKSVDYIYDETARYNLEPNSTRTCFTGSIIDDTMFESEEEFDLSLTLQVPSVRPAPVVDPDISTIIIEDDQPPVSVNYTVVGDPFFTAPVNIDPEDLGHSEVVSLCYEIHGRPATVFNLVNDECTAVNARYFQPHSGIDINVINTIAVRAVDEASQCRNIQVDLSGCSTSIDGTPINNTFQSDGISVRRYPGRVRIAVPNCETTQLVMWVFCQSGKLRNPNDGEYMDTDMIRFVIARGLSLREESHGLIGQFWNVAFDIDDYVGDRGQLNPDSRAIVVTYRPGTDKSRHFVSILETRAWDRTKQPCLYSGNRQGGPIGDIDSTPNDSVIEGTYKDYIVNSLFGSDCKFCSMFNNAQCSG